MILGDPLFSLSFLDIFLPFLCHRPICLLALPVPGCAPGPLCESQSQARPLGCILALSGFPHLWVLICFPDPLSPPNQPTPAGFLSGLAMRDSMAALLAGEPMIWRQRSDCREERELNIQNQAQKLTRAQGFTPAPPHSSARLPGAWGHGKFIPGRGSKTQTNGFIIS